MKQTKHQHFDINHLPKQPGLLLFGISMNRISNAQSAQKCFDYMESFIPKIIKPQVGLNLIYSDSLYYNSPAAAKDLKKKFENLTHAHKFAFTKIMEKHPLYIQNSINYSSWSQMILECKDFFRCLSELKKMYTKDKDFKSLVLKDIGAANPPEEKINFILEEILMFYLCSKGVVRLPNDFVNEKHQWILWCYPGKPLASEVYLYQTNPFKLSNPANTYENSYYDLTDKKLYNFTKL
ncbi:MAG: hypothetical protein KBB55_01045 [Candidatus Buchananbacteria bacterium]|nr:hypothetical protein [Candidatus Buchananbacteria bacterium]